MPFPYSSRREGKITDLIESGRIGDSLKSPPEFDVAQGKSWPMMFVLDKR
jgi:hypothetical protein